jgi:LysM repeat protein
VDRHRITRWAAPAAFLAAVTIGALVVRAGLHQGGHHATTPTTTVTAKKKVHRHQHRQRRTYTIQRNDTLASIAAKEGTTVARLMKLNPGINPTALTVGARIRVQ